MERPSHCQFGPDGALYVVDFGAISIAPEKGGIRMWEGTGALWRVRRTDGVIGAPPTATVVSSYAIKALLRTALAAAVLAALAAKRTRR